MALELKEQLRQLETVNAQLRVGTSGNHAEAFKPYDAARLLGDTTGFSFAAENGADRRIMGDEIALEMPYATFTYEVEKTEVVAPTPLVRAWARSRRPSAEVPGSRGPGRHAATRPPRGAGRVRP